MEDGELSGEGQELLQRGEEGEGGIAQAQAAWPVTEPSDARIVGVLDCQHVSEDPLPRVAREIFSISLAEVPSEINFATCKQGGRWLPKP